MPLLAALLGVYLFVLTPVLNTITRTIAVAGGANQGRKDCPASGRFIDNLGETCVPSCVHPIAAVHLTK